MKTISLLIFILVTITFNAYAQDTFSIVAADSTTREVGSAGASCVDLFTANITDATFIGDVLPDTGAINTQAAYLSTNQKNARTRMRAGDSPSQMITWLNANDVGSSPGTRQYGIVKFSGKNVSAEGFTGTGCMDYKNHKTGSIKGIYYSIQGNILLGQQVIDSIESRFRAAKGDLACRLMAALQGAKMVGADTRCAPNNSSTLFAFVKVAQPTDKYGSPSFLVSVRTHNGAHIEPVDTLQKIFNGKRNCNTVGLNETTSSNYFTIYPNPSNGKIDLLIREEGKLTQGAEVNIYNMLGRKVYSSKLNSHKTEIDLSKEAKGIYFYSIQDENENIKSGKLIIE